MRKYPTYPRRLIISSGDISDVDGLYAIAKYAYTECDVLFIMNYPAYLGVKTNIEKLGSGLGYRYDTKTFLDAFEANKKINKSASGYQKYRALLYREYKGIGDISGRVKQLLTDMAYSMVSNTWNDMNVENKGNLYFCIGGINSFNPFSEAALKNEMYVYADLLAEIDNSNVRVKFHKLSSRLEGHMYRRTLNARVTVSRFLTTISDFIDEYNEIYIDFNGSMAFFNEEWETALRYNHAYIKGVFVMGGVFSYQTPCTMPSIAGVLNRFSCATMNQLYHPINTAKFFEMLKELRIDVYVVSNNAVGNQESIDSTGKKTNDGWMQFLNTNFERGYSIAQLNGQEPILQKLANAYYNCEYTPPRRAFDFYTSVALVNRVNNVRIGTDAQLFFDNRYGITLVSEKTNKKEAMDEYSSMIDVKQNASDNDFIKAKKQNFILELDILNKTSCEMINIKNVEFDDISGRVLTIRPPGPVPDLVMSVQYYKAVCDYHISVNVQRVSGEELYNSPNELQLRIRFDPTTSVPVALIFNNGNSWIPQYYGRTYRQVKWDTFLRYNNERPDKTMCRIEEFDDLNNINMSLQAYGPDPGPSSEDCEPCEIIYASFKPRRY